MLKVKLIYIVEQDLLQAQGISNHQLEQVGAAELEKAFEELLRRWLLLDEVQDLKGLRAPVKVAGGLH